MKTKVMKFGGSSVSNAVNISKVVDIVSRSLNKDTGVVVVVSAFGGVTDELINLANLASKKDFRYKAILQKIYKRHDQAIKELIKPKFRQKMLIGAKSRYDELEKITKKIFIYPELSKASLDAVMSFGEQLSAYIINEAMRDTGLSSKFIDARDLIRTDDNFTNANVDIETSYKSIRNHLQNRGESRYSLAVTGGFIGSTKDSVTTTLGRGGSDYSAALIGAALDATVIEIWTDVDGLMTADPRVVKNAKTIPEISYAKAEEMALSGAKVIHPKTIEPARIKNIPIYIKNTFNKDHPGTLIKD